jgi:hypothetical protein
MRRDVARVVATVALMLATTGCGTDRAPSAPPPIVLLNQPSFPPGTICNDAMRRGPLTRDAVSGLGVGGKSVRWPWRWTAVLVDGHAHLYDELGHHVAEEGDAMEIGGSGIGNVWSMCGGYHVGLPYTTVAP